MKFPQIKYESKDDVLNIWLSHKRIDDADDINGVIIHYTKDREPVYIEILDASRLLGKEPKSFSASETKFRESAVATLHQIRK
ncbi:DUF2283 domain-containing protein [Candidatus Daviesbacteria bacterium]|nr:DUF2283 domain-containing protein [Candidatus Daviesbacteria bacterium]